MRFCGRSAPRDPYILMSVWLGAALILAAGCLSGLVLGGLAAWLVGHLVEQRTGLVLAVGIGWPEVLGVLGLVVIGSLMALLPAVASFRTPVGDSAALTAEDHEPIGPPSFLVMAITAGRGGALSLKSGPARRRRLEGRALAFTGMLDGQEQRAVIRREGRTADLRALGGGEELPRQRPALARHVAGIEAVGDAGDLAAVGGDPPAGPCCRR